MFIMCFGDNQEDSIVLNRDSVERGIFSVCHGTDKRVNGTPQIGDKFTTLFGQKGTVGAIVPSCFLPRTADGVCPDVILNPHAFPKRMTSGQLIEGFLGKVAAVKGKIFYKGREESLRDVLNRSELECGDMRDTEAVYSFSGRKKKREVYVGICRVLRLHHLSVRKFHACASGSRNNLTKQAPKGIKNEGGYRVGEMEVACLIAQSAFELLRDRWVNSDMCSAVVCICGYVFTPEMSCDCAVREIVQLPYSVILFCAEMLACGIFIKHCVEKNVIVSIEITSFELGKQLVPPGFSVVNGVLVIPKVFRPDIFNGKSVKQDKLTDLYDELGGLKRGDIVGIGIVKGKIEKYIKSQRVDGKSGRVRQGLMGKRCFQSARAVLTCRNSLLPSQVCKLFFCDS